MPQQPPPASGLALLAEAFRSKRTGLLVAGDGEAALRVRLEAGQITALGPAPAEAAGAAPLPKPNDSVRLRLERVLAELGMRKPLPSADPPGPASTPTRASLRDRLIERLADDSEARFEEGGDTAEGLVAVAVATEPLILEAVRQMRHDDAVRAALGDLDQPLVTTTALADERTLTLTEGYLLSRIDGLLSAREVLQLAPLDPQETERTLLGLMLTGRVERRPARQPAAKAEHSVSPPETAREAAPAAETPRADAVADSEPVVVAPAPGGAPPEAVVAESVDEPIVEAVLDDEETETATADAPKAPQPVEAASPQEPAPPQDAATIGRRRDILEFFQSLPLKNHFEVLGVEPGCTDAEVRKAYVTLVKRYHPDSQRDRRLEDLHDILEGITIRLGEAWEVLGQARSRESYESRSGIGRPSTKSTQRLTGLLDAAASGNSEPGGYVPPEETLFKARRLLSQARYWDAIQVLESALPRMEPQSQQHRGRLLLARAYSKNPNWLRRAEEMLHQLMREDPTNADVHYELGLVYKTGGFTARAQGMFRRAVELRPGHKDASAELGIQAAEPGSSGGGLLKRLFKRGKAS
jgi:curved DNA-binding protein CbpA